MAIQKEVKMADVSQQIQEICINSSAIPTYMQPMASEIGKIMSLLSVFVGGIIGLYILFMILQWRERVLISKKLDSIQRDMDKVKMKLGLKVTHERKRGLGFFGWNKFKRPEKPS